MSTPPDTLDRLVLSYLDAVERALTGLPEDRRRELRGDLSDHIAAERAALDSPTEAAVRAILDRLGDPITLATEARLVEDSPVTPSPVIPFPITPSATMAPVGRSGTPRLGLLGWVLVGLGLALLIFLVFGAVVTTGDVADAPVPAPAFPPPPSGPR